MIHSVNRAEHQSAQSIGQSINQSLIEKLDNLFGQDVQEKLRAEIGQFETVDEKSLAKMRYLKACMKEAMRIAPVSAQNGKPKKIK